MSGPIRGGGPASSVAGMRTSPPPPRPAGTEIPSAAEHPAAPAHAGAGRGPIRRFVVKHPIATFLALAFGVSWPVLFGLVLLRQPVEPGLIVVVLLGLAGPAVLVSAAEGGRPAVRALLSRTFRWRVHPGWYALATFGLPVFLLLAATVARGAAPLQQLLADPRIVTGYLTALLIVPLINLWEETGWMFVQTRLEQRHGPRRGGIITGLFFAALHLPIYLDLGSARNTGLAIVIGFTVAPFFRILAGWLYRQAGSSVLIVALFHGSFNASNSEAFGGALFPGVPAAITVGAAVILLGTTVIVSMRKPAHRLPRSATAGAAPSSEQYSLAKILAIWAVVTAPMGVFAFVVAPAIFPHTSIHPGLVYWTLMVVGMAWQFVVSVVVLRHELGGLRWAAVKERIWWNAPRDPETGRPRRRLWWWAVPAIGANYLGGFLAIRLDSAWTDLLPMLREPSFARIDALADPRFAGQWWILGLTLTSMVFNYLLGEELLFRGVLLPRMAGVFGRWDWVANAVLFGLYHLHKIWFWPSMITSSFGTTWAARRYRSMAIAVLVHGIEGYFIVLILGVLLGLFP